MKIETDKKQENGNELKEKQIRKLNRSIKRNQKKIKTYRISIESQ